jgi:hypothetical protein
MGWNEPEQPAPPKNEANAEPKAESKKTETEKAEPSPTVEADKRPEDVQEEATMEKAKQPSQEPNGSSIPDEPDQTIRTSTWKGNAWDSEMPPTISLSGGQMQRVALSRAFMRADKATLVVLE